MKRPFEVDPDYLAAHLDALVEVTIADLTSAFLLLPRGDSFIEYTDFRDAFEALKRCTSGFAIFGDATIWDALRENSRTFCVLRAILGMTPPEWADLARAERHSDVSQGYARKLDRDCRANMNYVSATESRPRRARQDPSSRPLSLQRIDALISVAVQYITEGAPPAADGVVHRLAKFDTENGLESMEYAAREQVPYAVLLYERYLGRPFAGHRDAVSELVGEVMENAIEDKLRQSGITYRKTKRAERIPGFGQAPDFCIPDEVAPAVVIEAKITSDDGTARDKVTRIKALATQRDAHVLSKDKKPYEVVACIDGRGFRERREDMRQMLITLAGKVFTTATLDHLIVNTRLREFVTTKPEATF
ncbi:MAG: hypothetical protein ACYCVE_06370 [Gemmatimonadaceae bacterium]